MRIRVLYARCVHVCVNFSLYGLVRAFNYVCFVMAGGLLLSAMYLRTHACGHTLSRTATASAILSAYSENVPFMQDEALVSKTPGEYSRVCVCEREREREYYL